VQAGIQESAAIARDVRGLDGLGYPKMAPYDRICVTAAWMEIPPPLIEQLEGGGRLVAPLKEYGIRSCEGTSLA
jgi:protein-L-isoaspartate O-methyltransferase